MEQILEALKGHNQLIDIIKYVVDQCNADVEFEDNRSEGNISELTIWSECFTKKQLDILFQYADYREVAVSKGKMIIRLSFDI